MLVGVVVVAVGGAQAAALHAFGVNDDQRRQVVAFVAQFAIGVVFDDRHAVMIGDLHQLVSALQRQGDAAGVLEVGQDVHELRPGAQGLFQKIDAQTVVVDRHGDELGLVGAPGLQRAHVARPLGQDQVAGVDHDLADQVQRLLRTTGDEHVFRRGLDTVAGHVGHDPLAQRPEAFGGAILQRLRPMARQNAVGRLAELVHREDLRRGHAAAEGDDVGLLGQLEQLADGRGAHPLHALGAALVPGGCHNYLLDLRGRPQTSEVFQFRRDLVIPQWVSGDHGVAHPMQRVGGGHAPVGGAG